MEKDSFTFNQDDLKSSSFSEFEDMRRSGQYIDFKITIQNRCFYAHRLILAAGVPYLRTMFASSVNEIPLEVIDPDVFEDVINFAYTGKITITSTNVQALLVASQLLQLTKVQEACLKYMALRVDVNNVFQTRSFAGNIQSLRLAATCDRCLLRNFELFVFSHHDEFLQLPFPYLKEMISRDDLNVVNEERVFEAVVKWVRASPVDRHSVLPELLCCVRMTRLAPEYLVERVSTEELVMSSAPCRYLVEESKNFHLLRKKPSTFPGSAKGCPRNESGHGIYALCSSTLGNFVELYDVEKELWITLAHIGSRPIDRVAGFNGKLYFFKDYSNEIEMFDAKTLKIESVDGPEDHPRSFYQTVVHNNKFYAFFPKKSVHYCFDPKMKMWLQLHATLDCEDSGIASMDDYIYITGGYINSTTSNICKRYNPGTYQRSNISSMLVERRLHGCASLNGKLYVCGGHSSRLTGSAEVYDPLTDQWSFVSPLKSLKVQIYLVAYKGRLYAFKDGKMEIYLPEYNEWKASSTMPSTCKLTEFATIPFPGDANSMPRI